jgi:hypothetical protein
MSETDNTVTNSEGDNNNKVIKKKSKRKFSPKRDFNSFSNNAKSSNDFINLIGENAIYHYQNYLLSQGLGIDAQLKNRPRLEYSIFVDLKRLFDQAQCFTDALLPATKQQRFVFNSSRSSDQEMNCFYAYIYSYMKALFSGVYRNTYNLRSNNGFLLEGHYVLYCLLDGRSFIYGSTNTNIPVSVTLSYTQFQKKELVNFLISCECLKNFRTQLEEFRDNGFSYFHHTLYETVLQNLSVAEHSNAVGKLRLRDFSGHANDFTILNPESNPLGNSAFIDDDTWSYVYSQHTQLKFDESRSSFICRALFIKLVSAGQLPTLFYTQLPDSRELSFFCRSDVNAISGILSNTVPGSSKFYKNNGGILYGDRIQNDGIDSGNDDDPK